MVLGQDSALGQLPSLAEQLLVQMGTSCAQHRRQLVVGTLWFGISVLVTSCSVRLPQLATDLCVRALVIGMARSH